MVHLIVTCRRRGSVVLRSSAKNLVCVTAVVSSQFGGNVALHDLRTYSLLVDVVSGYARRDRVKPTHALSVDF
jgi:hypothetical protein